MPSLHYLLVYVTHPQRRGHGWPTDDRIWQIHWLGGLSKNPDLPSEPLLEVFLKPRMPGSPKNSTEPNAHGVRAKVGVGYFPAMRVGALWESGRPVALARLNSLSAAVDFSRSGCRVVRAGDKLPPGDQRKAANHFYIPPFDYRLEEADARRAFCVVYPLTNGRDEIILPCTEVARAWYLRSTTLVHAVLGTDPYDWIGSVANPERTYLQADGGYRLGLRKQFSFQDAVVVATVLLNEDARVGAKRIFESMVRSLQSDNPAEVFCMPPVSDVQKVRAHGVWTYSGGVRRFLVHHLSQVPFPDLPELHVEHDSYNPVGPGTAIDGETNQLPAAWPGHRNRGSRVLGEETVSSEEEPDLNMPLCHVGADLPEISNPPSITPAAPRDPVSRSVSSPGGVEFSPHHSTAPGRYSEGNPTPLRIVNEASSSQMNRTSRLPSDFQSFSRALSYLESFGLHAEVLSIDADPIRANGLVISQVDVSDPRNNQRAARSGGQPRQYVLVELTRDGLVAYCWEFEPRQSSSHSASKSGPPTAVICTSDGSQMTREQIRECVSAFVTNNGVWPQRIGDSIQVDRIAHRHTSERAFAEKIVHKYKTLCVGSDASVANDPQPEESGLAAAH